MTVNPTMAQVQERLNNTRIPLLGRYVWLSRLAKIEMPIDELVDRWTAANLAPDYLPEGIRARTSMLRTIDQLKAGGLLDHADETDERSIYALLIRKGDVRANTLGYDVKVEFHFLKKERRIVVTDPAFQDLVDGYFARFQEVFLTKDIRKIVLDAMRREGCVSLKDDGGIYYLPVAKFPVIDKLAAFVAGLGAGCTLQFTNVPDTPDDAQVLAGRVDDEMIADLDRLADEVADLIGASTTRRKTLESRLDELDEQRAKARMFAQFLAIQSEDISEKIATIDLKLRHRLGAA